MFNRTAILRNRSSRPVSGARPNAPFGANALDPLHPQLSLLPVPEAEWSARMERLMQDEFLRTKYDRSRRLTEKWNYLHEYLPELVESPRVGATVIDIGPGPGEFLEWCRHLGYEVRGVDAAGGQGGMGDGYLALSQLLTQRQQIPVDYCGLTGWIDRHAEVVESESVALINSQGSIEQACSHMMLGESHDKHHDCRKLKWQTGDVLRTFFCQVMSIWKSLLLPGGTIFIYANGAANTPVYAKTIERAAREVGGLELILHQKRIHKWQKKRD